MIFDITHNTTNFSSGITITQGPLGPNKIKLSSDGTVDCSTLNVTNILSDPTSNLSYINIGEASSIVNLRGMVLINGIVYSSGLGSSGFFNQFL